jgi:hypothetical protein
MIGNDDDCTDCNSQTTSHRLKLFPKDLLVNTCPVDPSDVLRFIGDKLLRVLLCALMKLRLQRIELAPKAV